MKNTCTIQIVIVLMLSSLLLGPTVRGDQLHCDQEQNSISLAHYAGSDTYGAAKVSSLTKYRKRDVQIFYIGGAQFRQTPPDQSEQTNLAEQAQELDEATRLQQQAEKLIGERKYEAAASLAKEALAIREKVPARDLDIAESLTTLGSVYYFKGDFGRAEPLFRRALSIRETRPDNDLLTAESLNNLAALYSRMGDVVKPEPLYLRALDLREKKLGPDSPDLVPTLNNLATIYKNRGDLLQAETLFRRALSIRETKLPPDDPKLITSLNNLGQLYVEKREYPHAEPLFKRALNIAQKTGTDTSALVNNLAVLYYNMGNFAEAEPLFQRTLTAREKLLGTDHPDLVPLMINLADTYRMTRKYELAELLWPRILEISKNKLGDQHPDLGTSLHHLALLDQAMGRYNEAVRIRNRGNELREYNLALALNLGSEAQKIAYMKMLADETDVAVSLHLENARLDLSAARLALTTILQRKGRILDVMSNSIETLRRRATPEDRTILDKLFATRSQLANLILRGPGKLPLDQYQAEVIRLQKELQRFESEVSARSAEFRAKSQSVTLERVQAAIPVDAVLVEFVVYRPFNVMGRTNEESFGAPNYAAYVVRRSGRPMWVRLGQTAEIDKGIARLRDALRDPTRLDVKAIARRVDERVMRPVRPLLGEARRILVSPDGELNLIPFAALVDEHNEYLITKYTFTFLTSGRDLLRLQVEVPSREPPVVIANPAFSTWSSAVGNSVSQPDHTTDRSIDFTKIVFRSLPGTAGEATALAKILPRAKTLTGLLATEAAVKEVTGPSILHLATHGFFFANTSALEASTGYQREGGDSTEEAGSSDTALLRSALVFAGVRQRQSGVGEDGILTALEATGLDLWGTKLVVLSACDTGVGEVHSGEGVYGLRRALVLAGAESQVMSLWPVNDRVTRELIVEYYESLQAQLGRAEALRNVQLRMLKSTGLKRRGSQGAALQKRANVRSANYGHPFYWASFIQAGNWRSFDSSVRVK